MPDPAPPWGEGRRWQRRCSTQLPVSRISPRTSPLGSDQPQEESVAEQAAGPGSRNTRHNCKTGADAPGRGKVCVCMCAGYAAQKNCSLDTDDEDSAQEVTNVFHDRGRRKGTNTGTASFSRKSEYYYKRKLPFSSVGKCCSGSDWMVCADVGCANLINKKAA